MPDPVIKDPRKPETVVDPETVDPIEPIVDPEVENEESEEEK